VKSILDPTFKYYSAVDTDLRRTFQRIREEMRQSGITRSQRRQPAAPGQIAPFTAPRRLRMADWGGASYDPATGIVHISAERTQEIASLASHSRACSVTIRGWRSGSWPTGRTLGAKDRAHAAMISGSSSS